MNNSGLGCCIKRVAGRKATGCFEKKNRCGVGHLEVATSLGGRDLVYLDMRSRLGNGRRDLAE